MTDAPAPAASAAPPADAAPDRGRLNDLLGYHLRRAAAAAFHSFHNALDRDGVNPAQLGVLLMVQANPGINQTRVGRALGIDRSTLVSIIDALEARGVIERTPSPTDRRSHALLLTGGGGRFLSDLAPRLEAHEAEIAGDLSAAERRTLIALLNRIMPA